MTTGDIHFIAGTDDNSQLRSWLEENTSDDTILGLDCETTGLNPWASGWKLRMVQLSDGDSAICVEVAGKEDALRVILNDPRLKFVSHTNIDSLFLWAGLGVDLTGRCYDTHILSVLTAPGRDAKHGLKHLTEVILGSKELSTAQQWLHEEFKNMASVHGIRGSNKVVEWGFAHVPIDNHLFVTYAGLDAIYVRRLFDRLIARQPNKLWIQEHRIADECLKLRIRGLRIDLDRTQTLYTEVKGELDLARQRLEAAFGFPALSPKRVDWLRQRGCQFNPEYKTPKGEVSLCAAHVDVLADRYREGLLGQVIGDMQTLAHLKNLATNLYIFLTQATQSRVHPSVVTQRAVTGRMSITGVPMQTLKKEDKRLRGLFVADPGMTLISCDFSQVEVRVAAALSKDERLSKLILDGEDVHSATAQQIFGEAFTDHERKIAKVANFGSLYGGGATALAVNTGIDEGQARSIVQQWRKVYPGLVEYGKQLATGTKITNFAGRTIPLDPDRPYAALNYMIQSSARDLFVQAVHRVVDLGLSENLWLLIHDEVIVQVPTSEATHWATRIQQAMECEFEGIPITAEAEILGQRWSGNE